MVYRNRDEALRICQYLGALAALALLTASFANSPLREAIVGQLYALNYVRGGYLRDMIDLPPVAPAGTAWNDSSGSLGPTSRADIVGGFYDRRVAVTLTQSKSAPIHYTLDGGLPTLKAMRYREPIVIDRTTVLTFASLSPELQNAPVETHTYLIDEKDRVPVLSLAIDPMFLWNRHAGLLLHAHQRGAAWRRPARVEYFEDRNSRPVSIPVEMNIHGNWSRSAPKKSFQLSFANARVSGVESEGILAGTGVNDGQRAVIVRAAAMDISYRLGDELFRSLFADSGGLISRPTMVQLLLNGARWGLYNLHAKIDKTFLNRAFGNGEYDLVEDPSYGKKAEDGAWSRLLDFFITQDLSKDDNLEKAKQLIDFQSFTYYWIFNIVAANLDWPHTNYYAFRKRAPGERWRWISWDADATFDANRGLRHDTLSWATRAELRHDLSYNGAQLDEEGWLVSTAIIRSLLKNRNYEASFVRDFCELRARFFSSDLLQTRFQRILDRMTPHFAVDWEHWPGSKQAYQAGVQGVRRFIAERPAIVLRQFQQRFRFTDCPAA